MYIVFASNRKMNFQELKKSIVKDRDMGLIKPVSETNTLQIFLGVTVKSITENEMEGIMNLAYTLTIKMVENMHDQMFININKEGDIIPNYRNLRAKMDSVRGGDSIKLTSSLSADGHSKPTDSVSPLREQNDTSELKGIPVAPKEGKPGYKLITRSAHMNSSVKCVSDVDFCPFIVSTYDLSIKLNSLDDDNSLRKKLKTVFVSRYLHHFIEFQAGAIGKGISKADFVSVLGVSKVRDIFKGQIPEIGRTKHDGLWIDINEAQYETDEIVIRFTTRRKQISNVVRVVLPCILVPLIFGEMSRRSTLGPDSLLTGVLTLIFAMPDEFGFGTSLWFGFAFVLCGIAYIVNHPHCGLAVEVFSVLLGFGIAVAMYIIQGHKIVRDNEGGHIIANLTKDKDDAWRKLSLGERFCLV